MKENNENTVQDESLWKGFKKRNPYAKHINPNVADNFSSSRQEVYAILARVSTDMQFKDGESFDAQIERAKRLIEKKGGVLYEIYREEGISAYNKTIDERPVMQRLKEDIISGRVNHLIVYKRNRISRRQQDRKNFFAFLAENGCKLTLTNTGEEVDVAGKDKITVISEDLQGHFDEFSSKETSENVTDTMWEMAMYKGRIMGGQAPVGYETVYKEKDEDYGNRIPTFVPIEEFQPTRQLIEKLYLSGYGYGAIARYLNGGKVKGLEQLLVPVKKPQVNSSVSSEWNDKNIETILFNPTYTGYYSYQIYRYDDYAPVIKKSPYIVACRTEDKQKELNIFRENKLKKTAKDGNNKRFAGSYLLTGILVCKHCGTPYETVASKRKDGKTNAYYRCRNRFSSKKVQCQSATFSQKVLEATVIEKVEEILNQFIESGTIKKVRKRLEEKKEVQQTDLISLQKDLQDKENEAMNLASEISKLNNDPERNAMKLEMYRKREDVIYDEMSKLRSLMNDIQKQNEDKENEDFNIKLIMNTVREFSNVFPYSPVTKQKAILNSLIHKIVVDKDFKVEIIFNWQIQETENVIVSKKIGEGIVVENIKVSIGNFVCTIDYFERLNRMKTFIYEHFFEFLTFHDKKLSYTNLSYESPILNSPNIEIPLYPKQTTITNQYIEHKLEISISTRRALQNNKIISPKTFRKILEKMSLQVEDYMNFLEKNYQLICSEELFYESLECRITNDSDDIYLDKLVCGQCGSTFRPYRKYGTLSYRCKRKRSEHKERCTNKVISLKKLNDYFESSDFEVNAISEILIVNGEISSTRLTKDCVTHIASH